METCIDGMKVTDSNKNGHITFKIFLRRIEDKMSSCQLWTLQLRKDRKKEMATLRNNRRIAESFRLEKTSEAILNGSSQELSSMYCTLFLAFFLHSFNSHLISSLQI